jgi:ubiquinone biosynthesis monooxygenase Coq7
MQQEEAAHAYEANQLGAGELPSPIKKAMSFASKIMTGTAYYV